MKDTIISKTIDFLRFPMIVGVVFIHSNMQVVNIQGTLIRFDKWPAVAFIMNFFSSVLADVCVPLFFFFSGFLFFYYSDFSKYTYINKIKKRIRTLLVPYLIWNFVAFLILLIQVHPRIVVFFPLLKDYRVDIVSFLSSFWVTNLPISMSGPANPINTPLWFIRDLMILVLLSPIIWWLIKKMCYFFIIFLGVIWFFSFGECIGLPNLCHQSIFFFPLGAYFGINKLNFVEMTQKVYWIPFVYIAIALLDALTRVTHFSYVIHNVEILIGMMALVYISSSMIKRRIVQVNTFLVGASFFVYALHNLFLGKLTKVIVMLVQPNSPISVLLIYYSMPFIAIIICLSLYKFLCSKIPSFCSVITGGR